MALTRKMLKGMGLTDEQVDAIIEGHQETVTGLRSQITNPTPKPEPKEKGKNINTQSEEQDEWKTKYEQLVAENELKEENRKKEEALKALLADSKLSDKGQAKALKYTSLDDIELGQDGKIKGGKRLLDTLCEEWSDYVTEENTEGTETESSGGGNNSGGSSGTKMTREEIMKIPDAGKRQAAIAENHELFNF